MSPRVSLAMAAMLLVVFAPGVLASTNDPLMPQQWGLSKIQAEQAWSRSRGSVTVAAVDTGVDFGHPDLAGKSAGSYSCVNRDPCDTNGAGDDNGHGTRVAGIIAADTGNGIGIAGVAPDARIMSVKVLDSSGGGSDSDVARGIRWAADRGAKVINLSLASSIGISGVSVTLYNTAPAELADAINYAASKGVLVVAAAGNDDILQTQSLTAGNSVYLVGATGPNDEVAFYSNSGEQIFAPGGDEQHTCSPQTCILSTSWTMSGSTRQYSYTPDQGTSYAAPHVAGVGAMLMAAGYSNSQAISRMDSTADPIPGGKRVNAARALAVQTAASPSPSPGASTPQTYGSPTPQATSPAPGQTQSGQRKAGKAGSPAPGAAAASSPAAGATPGAESPAGSPPPELPASASSPDLTLGSATASASADPFLAPQKTRSSSTKAPAAIVALIAFAAAGGTLLRIRLRRKAA